MFNILSYYFILSPDVLEMTTVPGSDLDIFNEPARLIVSGYSGSGKSHFVVKLLKKYSHKFKKIIVVGSDLENTDGLNIERKDTFNPFLEDDLDSPLLIVYDDVLFNKKIIESAAEVYIRGRHLNISAIFLTQNLFFSNSHFRVISLNASHYILFKSRDLKQISHFSRSFLLESQVESFIKLYRKYVMKEKYRYILIDFTKDIESPLAIRKNIVGESYEIGVLL